MLILPLKLRSAHKLLFRALQTYNLNIREKKNLEKKFLKLI